MTLRKQLLSTLLKWTLLFLLGATSCVAFVVWAPWSAATSIHDAERLYGRTFPADWKAVNVNHGTFTNEPWGTPDEHPIAYFFLSCVVFAPALVFVAIGFRKGYKSGDDSP